MKYLLLLVGIIMLAGFVLYPYVVKEKTCYDQAQQANDEIGMNVPAKGWDQAEVCNRRVSVVTQLGACVTEATSSGGFVTTYGNSFIEGALYLVRPLTHSFATQKQDHNSECGAFEQYQLQ